MTADRLRHNILFGEIGDGAYDEVRAKLRERRYRADEVILEDESDGEELFLIADGRVRIVKRGRFSEEKLLALLHPGDFFGELELVDGRPRSARVVAMDDCTTYTLARADFEALLAADHGFAVRLMQVLSLRLRALNNHFVSELERNARRSAAELKKLERLIEASKVLNSTLDLNKLLTIILDTALSIVNGDRGTVYLIDERRGELWSKVLRGTEIVTIRLPMGKGIAGHVAATGETLNIAEAYLDPRFNPEVDRKSGYRTNTILCMPMRDKDGRTIGVFQLLNKRDGPFTHDDESFLDALSVHVAIAIENARLHEEEKALLRMREEVRLAAQIQHDLLPKSIRQLPGYDIAGTSVAAQVVGGDLYDCIPVDECRAAVCLGDVSGKGLPAALLMANVQATLRAQTMPGVTPRDCVRRANGLLYASTSSEKFVTLFYGVLDADRHELRYVNAGHDHPIVCSSSGAMRRLATGGIVLGIMESFPFEEETLPVPPGEVIVVYSDGVAEAMNGRKKLFGEERLLEVVAAHRGGSALEIVAGITAAVKKHTGTQPQYDDMTLIVVKRNS